MQRKNWRPNEACVHIKFHCAGSGFSESSNSESRLVGKWCDAAANHWLFHRSLRRPTSAIKIAVAKSNESNRAEIQPTMFLNAVPHATWTSSFCRARLQNRLKSRRHPERTMLFSLPYLRRMMLAKIYGEDLPRKGRM